ncbi:tripartite tricarboxylate transporter TctB family protein [Desulfogranum mediterraneum]|uniref:tripartite tricarboxylate transporter TctB family protein n=1 Tax=Desulfogranum mediterraneum TaxID=160661 RepID=UPI00040430B7|nr:tripartite tricarboxylate transporter TctB family protein [Desulfogranum mediterraneum]
MVRFPPYTNKTDLFIGLILFGISCPFLLNMHHFVSGGMSSASSPLAFPRFIISIVVLLSLLLMITGWFGKGAVAPSAPGGEEGTDHNPKQTRYLFYYLALLFLYLILLHYLGFMISTPIVMLMVSWLLHGRNLLVLTPLAVGFSVALYYLALHLMKIILPMGVLFE